ncbi:unnamed protein product [Scytosiphon promiscuus]
MVCSACTFRNESGARVCCVCETPLVDDAPAEWDPILQQDFPGGLTKSGGNCDIGSSVFIPSFADLKARTVAEGGDRESNTPGLIPRIHERLLGVHSSEGGMGGRNTRAPAETRERQTFMRGRRGVLDLCSTKEGASGRRRRGSSAQWRLCDQRTMHCTQRGLQGSSFSCGYRNIQMLCSALMEWPEYRRVLFGGSGYVPGVALLQCWIERAWADGFDPEGCEQLGGHGALMGSETWIGATECATLLSRSFGVKAEVVDFESTAPPAPADDEARPGYNDVTPLTAAAEGKGRAPPSLCARSSNASAAIAEHDKTIQQVAHEAGRWLQTEQRLGTGGNGTGHGDSGGYARRGGSTRSGGPRGRGGGRGRGWRRGRKKRRNNGNIGKEAGDRMGKALMEWAWQYFCTPWAAEEGDGSGLSLCSEGDVRPSPPPSQLREPGCPGGEAVASSGAIEGFEPSSSSGMGSTRAKARARPPPPLYFQHDGHSRSIVGVLLPGGGGAQAKHQGSNKRQAGSLLVFDPSHVGSELVDALGDTQKALWGRLLKRGEHSFQRRHFQMVVVRAGLMEPGQSSTWKKIESVKVWVA